MEVLRPGHELNPRYFGGVYAIGNFDGVHLGHQSLLGLVAETSGSLNKTAGVINFDPHPRLFFNPDTPYFQLTILDQRMALFDQAGMDIAAVFEFDANMARLSPEEFVRNILVDRLKLGGLVMGYDFHFGAKRAGTPELMIELGKFHGFDVRVVDPQGRADRIYSSSSVRDDLRSGNVRAAACALGRWWRVEGNVIKGAQRGRHLGFPTANIKLLRGQNLMHGIYAVHVFLEGQKYSGAAYLGTRPTFDDGVPILETHIFDFQGNLYGEQITIEFIDFLRGDSSFESEEQLKRQMQEDCSKIRSILAEASEVPEKSGTN
ncbi:MAG: bifunctional riboflavin kinase/FAD synthetase [Methyloligellaceae bacterium]